MAAIKTRPDARSGRASRPFWGRGLRVGDRDTTPWGRRRPSRGRGDARLARRTKSLMRPYRHTPDGEVTAITERIILYKYLIHIIFLTNSRLNLVEYPAGD